MKITDDSISIINGNWANVCHSLDLGRSIMYQYAVMLLTMFSGVARTQL